MHKNVETIKAIREKCQSVLLEWEILEKATDLVIVTNPETKVGVSAKIEREGDVVYSIVYKITDQTAIMRPKKATVIFYSDGDFHCEYSAFKSEEEILESLNK